MSIYYISVISAKYLRYLFSVLFISGLIALLFITSSCNQLSGRSAMARSDGLFNTDQAGDSAFRLPNTLPPNIENFFKKVDKVKDTVASFRQTSLHYAAEVGCYKYVYYFVEEAKVDPFVKDNRGNFPYKYLPDNADYDLYKLLMPSN